MLDWVRTIRSLVQGRIHKLKNCVNSRPKSIFKDQEAVKCLSSLHDKYVIVPADKASSNIVSETLMLNDIQITSDYMSRWVVLKRRVGAVTSHFFFPVDLMDILFNQEQMFYNSTLADYNSCFWICWTGKTFGYHSQ
jgi:hypothetical protein